MRVAVMMAVAGPSAMEMGRCVVFPLLGGAHLTVGVRQRYRLSGNQARDHEKRNATTKHRASEFLSTQVYVANCRASTLEAHFTAFRRKDVSAATCFNKLSTVDVKADRLFPPAYRDTLNEAPDPGLVGL